MVAGIPCGLVGVVGGPIPRSHVDHSNLVDLVRVSRKSVEELALRGVCYRSVLENLGIGKSKDGYRRGFAGNLILQMSLIKDVPLTSLCQENDTLLMFQVRLAVCMESKLDTASQALDASVLGEVK